jgi:PAS domain S-box-containing protein
MKDKELRSQLEGLFSDLEKPIRAEEGQPAFLEDTVEDITERKREEERVRRSQKTLQTLLDSMPFGVVIIGKDKKIRRANNAALASMGYESEEQIVGMVCHRTLCPAEAGKCPILDLGQELDRSERILVTKDRRHIPILKSVVPITLDWEDVLLEAFVDFTERKREEETLLRLERAVEQSVDGIAVADLDGNIQFVNPAWAQMHGYGEEGLQGKHLSIFHTEEQLQEDVIPFNERVMEVGAHQGEVGHVRKDGTTFPTWMTTTLLKDEKGNLIGLVGTTRDITEQKEAEEALFRLERAVEQSIDGIAIPDLDGNIQFVNSAWAQMHGYSVEELLGKHLSIFHTEEQLQEDVIPFNKRVMEVGAHQGEVGHVRKDGTTFPTWMTTTLLKDEKGNPVGLVGTARDITEQKRLEQAVQESLERRGRQVQTSTEVAQEIAAAPALDELYRRVVTLVKERFGYYHAQIFRHDPEKDAMVVVEGYGQAGERMKAAGHNLPYGKGVVGTAAATGEPMLVSDVFQDPNWVPHPDLPDTKGELAVPIKLRDEVLGVLDVQSDTAGALSEEDQVVLLGLAGQTASAIQSTSLSEQTQAALEEAEAIQRRYVREQWAEYVPARAAPSYERTQSGVTPLGDAVPPEVEQAMVRREVVVHSDTGDGAGQAALVAPISLRGEVIGALGLHETENKRRWTDDEISLIEAVADQMALAIENARLFEQTQSRAVRERLIREITDRIRGAVDVESILQTTVQEVGRALGTSHGLVRLGTEIELGDFSNESTNRE